MRVDSGQRRPRRPAEHHRAVHQATTHQWVASGGHWMAGIRREKAKFTRLWLCDSGLVSSIHEPCHPPNRSPRRVLQVWGINFTERDSLAHESRPKPDVNSDTQIQTTSDRNSLNTSAFGRSLGVGICARNFKVRSRLISVIFNIRVLPVVS